MLIKCPKCQTVYELDDNLIQDSGLKMRCSKCNEVFRAYKQDALKEQNIGEKELNVSKIFEPFARTTEPLFDTQKASHPSQKVQIVHLTRYKNTINYLLILVILALLGALLYLMRYDVVRYIPKAEEMYQKFGIESIKNGLTLDFENITTEEFIDNSTSKIKITGIINNQSNYTMFVPPLKVLVYNQQGEKLIDSTHYLPQKRMNPHYKIPFTIILTNPSVEQKNVQITFKD